MRLQNLFNFEYKNTRFDGKPNGGLITQFFGESKRLYLEVLGTNGHNGIDLYCLDGTEILAPIDMFISWTGIDSKGGLCIYGEYQESDTKRYELIFVHLQEFKVKAGDRVKQGDVIGLSDNTGWSSGSHLHFGVRPYVYDNKNNVWFKEFPDNGMRGYTDPLPFFSEPEKDMRLPLRRLNGKEDVYVIGMDGERHLIANQETFNRGRAIGFWGDDVEVVDSLPEKEGSIMLFGSSQ